jgi:hypothetical protein
MASHDDFKRCRPWLPYELAGCGLHGQELLGTGAAELRAQDGLLAREAGGVRWHRCLGCDSWLPLSPPDQPLSRSSRCPPARDVAALALRGRRCGTGTRCGASPRGGWCTSLVRSALPATLFLFAGNKAALNADFTRIGLKLLQGLSGPGDDSSHGSCTPFQPGRLLLHLGLSPVDRGRLPGLGPAD